MNINTLSAPEPRVFQLRVFLRDLEILQTVCRRLGWEFRAGQITFRWFGIRLDDITMSPDWGRCAHAIAVPGCLYEIGLQARDDHFVPVWDRGSAGGLEAVVGPDARLLWQQYALEVIRRAARQHGHTVGLPLEVRGVLRVRIAEPGSRRGAHIRMSSDNRTTFWTFGPQAEATFHYLADALGRIDGILPADGEEA